MGTRGFVGVVIDDVEKIVYNHMSSHPDCLGVEVLADVADLLATRPGWLREAARSLTAPVERMSPVDAVGTHPAFAEELGHAQSAGVLDLTQRDDETWYQLLRFEGLTEMLERGLYYDASEFPLEPDCEWGYLVDLAADDGAGRLELYQGHQKTRPDAGRWAHRPTAAEEGQWFTEHLIWCAQNGRDPWRTREQRYKAVKLIASWSLTALPHAEEMAAWAEKGRS